METNTKDAKIIDRIKALLAMGNDSSSPNEASIALDRARKLMDKHQVTMNDLEEATEDDLGESAYGMGTSRQKTWVSTMAIKVAKLNDCVVKLSRSFRREVQYKFCGFKEDAMVSEFMLAYLVETANRAYKQQKDALGLKGIADKNDFMLGFSHEICDRIHAMIEEREKQMSKASNSRALVVAKDTLVQEKYGEQKVKSVSNNRPCNLQARLAGAEVGAKTHLGAVMGSKMQAAGSLGA